MCRAVRIGEEDVLHIVRREVLIGIVIYVLCIRIYVMNSICRVFLVTRFIHERSATWGERAVRIGEEDTLHIVRA